MGLERKPASPIERSSRSYPQNDQNDAHSLSLFFRPPLLLPADDDLALSNLGKAWSKGSFLASLLREEGLTPWLKYQLMDQGYQA